MSNVARAFCSALAVILTAVLVGGAPPALLAQAPTPYELHAILSMTGPAAFLGSKEAEAMRIVEGDVNKRGGIRGRPIKIVIEDDQTNPQVAVQLLNGLIAQKVPIFVGATIGAACGAQLPIISKDGPTQYCLSPVIKITPGGYAFSANYAVDDILPVMLRYLRSRGIQRLGVLNGTDATGQDGDHSLEALMREPENAGLSVVAWEHYNLADLTVTAQLARIKAANAQALIVWVTGTPLATALRGLKDSGLDIPVLTSAGNMVYAQLESYKDFAPHELLFPGPPVFALTALTDRGVRRAIETFSQTFASAGVRPDQIHAFTWDVMQLVVDDLRRQGLEASAAQLRDGIATVRGWNGVMGKYDFQVTPQRGLAPTWITMLRWDPAKQTWVAASRPGGQTL